jgi:hypothetical protein
MRRIIIHRPVMALAFLVLASAPLKGQTGDSSRWMRRPQIRSIRAIVTSVDTSVVLGRFVERDTTVACYGGDVSFEITSHTDSQNIVRRIHFRGGSGDSAHDLSYYYDRQGRLRFAFAGRGAVNGTQEEERVYYDAQGKVIHRDVRQLEGPGYPWDAIDAITDPNAWLRNPCD